MKPAWPLHVMAVVAMPTGFLLGWVATIQFSGVFSEEHLRITTYYAVSAYLAAAALAAAGFVWRLYRYVKP